MRFFGYKKKFSDCSIRVITPYSAQRESIRKFLRQELDATETKVFRELIVGSVFETQGESTHTTHYLFIYHFAFRG